MITAEEARIKTKERQEELYQNELEKIELAINASINEGDDACYMDDVWISAKVKDTLEELGYEVKRQSFQDETCTVISWYRSDN